MQDSHLAEYKDIEWIVEELRALPKESRYFADVQDEPAYVRGYLEEGFLSGTLWGVCDLAKCSFLIAAQFKPWYADRTEIHEMILWVPSRFRGDRTAYKLIRAFTEEAIDRSPHSIHAGATLDITNAEATLKLYERVGYSRDGQGVIMRL